MHNTYYNNMMCYINYRNNDTDSQVSKVSNFFQIFFSKRFLGYRFKNRNNINECQLLRALV